MSHVLLESWNVSDGPVHGNTSQLFQLIVPPSSGSGQRSVPLVTYVCVGCLFSWLSLRPARRAIVPDVVATAVFVGAIAMTHGPPQVPRASLQDLAFLRRHALGVTSFRGLFEAKRCLPESSVVYHSEVGVVGLVFDHAKIVDLAGLHSKQGSHPFEQECRADRPDIIFLPHENYVQKNAEIAAAPCFADYVQVVSRSSSPMFLRADRADDFLSCTAGALPRTP